MKWLLLLLLPLLGYEMGISRNMIKQISEQLVHNKSNLFSSGDPLAAPTITQNPENVTVTEGNPAVFTATSTGNPIPTGQWQVNDGFSGWAAVDSGTTTGGTTETLTIPSPTQAMDGWQFRYVAATNPQGVAWSNPTTLTVNVDK